LEEPKIKLNEIEVVQKNLEFKKLKRELRNLSLTPIIQIGSVVVLFIGACISFYYAAPKLKELESKQIKLTDSINILIKNIPIKKKELGLLVTLINKLNHEKDSLNKELELKKSKIELKNEVIEFVYKINDLIEGYHDESTLSSIDRRSIENNSAFTKKEKDSLKDINFAKNVDENELYVKYYNKNYKELAILLRKKLLNYLPNEKSLDLWVYQNCSMRSLREIVEDLIKLSKKIN
jgi:hypothetical protein